MCGDFEIGRDICFSMDANNMELTMSQNFRTTFCAAHLIYFQVQLALCHFDSYVVTVWALKQSVGDVILSD